MKIRQVQLKNFRTYKSLELSLDKRLVFITGLNAMGKTNLLEALSVLSMGKSFRGASDREMSYGVGSINQGASGYYISCDLQRENSSFLIEIGCDFSSGNLRKKLQLNNKVVPGRSGLIGTLVTVVFSPSDIMIIEGGPVNRRKFLDSVLSRQDRTYLDSLIQFNRALRQRRAIIKRIKERQGTMAMLSSWTQSLSGPGQYIIRRRIQFIEEFREIFLDSLNRISGGRDFFEPVLDLSSEQEKEDYRGAIEKNIPADLRAGSTLIGPHRHNIRFQEQHQEAGTFGSQGQKRSIVLALRISEFYYLRKALGLSPVLLIDDVIRELDKIRRSAFVELLHECGQAIFTSPDLDGMEDILSGLREQSMVYRISEPGVVDTVTFHERDPGGSGL